MKDGRTLRVFLALMLLVIVSARAQVQVDISFKRSLYMVYEPIMCTVTITNLSGRTLELADTPQEKWFSFQIQTTTGTPLPPVNPDYQNQPVQMESGQRLVRTINLTPLYPLSEFGTYRVQAAVFSAPIGKLFVSEKLNIDITEGRLLWQETVGVPEGAGGGRSRTYSILAHRLPQTTMLYLRVEDKDAGVIYCTSQLGRFITFSSPDVVVDTANHIHVLQNAAPKNFLYSHFDVNGKLVKQEAYRVFKDRPFLVKQGNAVSVVGGVPYDPNAKAPEAQMPKMSDRPVPLPTPQGRPTPEEKRPENLLSR